MKAAPVIYRITSFILFFLVPSCCFLQNTCALVRSPVYPEETKARLEMELEKARESYKRDTANAEPLIWYGRRLAYVGRYEEAIEVFSKGMLLHPGDARMYRHRGHRFITVRCFDWAVSDLEYAAGLVQGQKDETEPDGLPNARNIQTSTLQSNIWYHLGLAYYLKGDYEKAVRAYTSCLEVSLHPDMYAATSNWLYISLLKLNREAEANKLLNTIDPSMDLIENRDYLNILLLYKGKMSEEDFLKQESSLSGATLLFGLGNYYLQKGEVTDAKEIFTKLVSGNQWASFAYIAAEKTLRDMP
jgi:tetratricopeptide (TPR) repeat protein